MNTLADQTDVFSRKAKYVFRVVVVVVVAGCACNVVAVRKLFEIIPRYLAGTQNFGLQNGGRRLARDTEIGHVTLKGIP